MKQYDLVVAGSGSGLMVLEEALSRGLRCAIVEKAKFGGTCLTKGCIPSKMLVYPADFIREAEMAERVGIKVQRPQIDWKTISRRMWEQIDFNEKIRLHLTRQPNLDVYHGSGSFISPHEMLIRHADGNEDEVVHGKRFVAAAGARSFVPEIEGLNDTGYLTSESFFGDKFPDKLWNHLAIIGGGPVGMEFAHFFSAYGVKITVIERAGRILEKEEEEISEFVSRQFVKNGVEILTECKITAVRMENGKKRISVESNQGGKRTIMCDELLVSTGVRSNADTLSMENAGVTLDQRGWIPTNEYLETSQRHIYAIGDINGKHQFRHKANYEAQVLANNLFKAAEKTAVDYSAVPCAIFTHPQVAHVGMTERELIENGIAYLSAKNHYSEVVAGRAMGYRTGDDDDGFVKMLTGENSQILGAHIVGPQAAVLLQPFVYLMQTGYQCRNKRSQNELRMECLRLICPQVGGYTSIMDSMVIHPSLNELTAWVFEKLERKT